MKFWKTVGAVVLGLSVAAAGCTEQTSDTDTGQDGGIARFSFFVTSLASLQKLSNSQDGFGGDLRFGEIGAGAGLRGADKLCAAIAELSMKGSSSKIWRAFLSASDDGTGKQVNAVERIGSGPWYDRLGRVVARTKADLLKDRPGNADAAIVNDLPNEFGVPNHQPDPTQGQVDNHHMLTGTGTDGKLYAAGATCKDWTTSDGSAANGKPRCGFSWPRRLAGPTGGDGGPPIKPPKGDFRPPKFRDGGGGKGGDGGQSAAGKGGTHWMTGYSAPGCAPGVDINSQGGAKPGSTSVGAGGGYGGFYCFALTP